ncbi:MAG TPA: 4-hydroxythreonine-4-phosphate dehydrogenase PdxA [Verrucomicrobiae bacterium]|nr:4-hydroxythreonine-4-phosphate dehydrogenase PdxA [Verrucomicrobiae bacterium]
MPLRIGITLGDVTGIGPEVALKAVGAVAGEDETRYVLIGDADCIQRWNVQLGLNLAFTPANGSLGADRFTVLDSRSQPLSSSLSHGAPEAARAAVDWLGEAADLCLCGELHAVVTAPVNKEAINRAGIPFVGQTEFFSARARADRTVMMLLGHDERGRWLRVALATVHIALRDVPVKLTAEKIQFAVERAAEACRNLGLARQRVAVCGLNPHCGEGGAFGDEEPRLIEPALAALRQRGLEVAGPLSGDTVFHHALAGEFDAVVAMYHDQGLAPLKTVAFDTGINWTLGLPFIRTSPDHGTAYNIAGQGIASPSSMISALRLAKQLAGRAA